MIAKQQALNPALVPLATFFVVIAAALGFLTLQGKEVFGLLGLLAVLGAALIALHPEVGILIFMTSLFVTYGNYVPTQGRFTPNNLLGLFFAFLLLLKLYRERDLWFSKERTLQIFTLLIMFFLLSSSFAEPQSNPIPELDLTAQTVHNLVTRFIFLIFFVNFIRTLRDVKLVLWVVLGLIFISAITGVQATGEESGPESYRAAATAGIQSAGNANRLAFLCVVGIGIIWYYRRVVTQRLLRLILTATIPGLAVAALMAGSRSGLVNLVVLSALIAIEGRFSIKKQIQMGLVAVFSAYLAAAFLTSAHFERLENLFPGASSGVKGTTSLDNRLRTLQEGLGIAFENPIFGVGIGNFRWVRFQKYGIAVPSHNSYVWAAAEGGIPALILYLMTFGVTLRNFLRTEQNAQNPELREIARGLRTSFLVLLVFSFFADFWLNVFTFVMIGLSIVVRRIQEREPVIVVKREFPSYSLGDSASTEGRAAAA